MHPRENWKKVLLFLWIGNFVISAGMSMIIPFLSIYVVQLGVTNESDAVLWAGLIFGANHLFIALFSPLWGRISDKYGQKLAMIRAGIGMGIVIGAMAFATAPVHLLLLRCVFGIFGGFGAASVSMMAIVSPRENAGEALGKLQTGAVAGGLIGPLIGGLFAESIGIKHTFTITGCAILISTLMIHIGVKETKRGSKEHGRQAAAGSFMAVVKSNSLIIALYFSSFLVAAGIQTIEPVLTLYVQSMGVHRHSETISGLIFATSALGTVVASVYLGKLGDRIGSQRILIICLLCSAISYLPEAFVTNPYMFSFLRLLNGVFIGGLIPSINALLRRSTASEHQGITFGLNQTAMSLGNVLGPLLGSLLDKELGIASIFLGTTILFFLNFVWIYYGVKKSPAFRKSQSVEI
jgi:MFS family permease